MNEQRDYNEHPVGWSYELEKKIKMKYGIWGTWTAVCNVQAILKFLILEEALKHR